MKEAKKILKCKEVTRRIQCMWSIKTKVMSVMAGAAGTISDSFREYLINMQESTKSRNYRK
jgi:hypothetical protein